MEVMLDSGIHQRCQIQDCPLISAMYTQRKREEKIMARTTRQVARRNTPRRYSSMKYRGKPTRDEQSQQTGSAIIAIGAALGIVVLFVLGFALVATVGRDS